MKLGKKLRWKIFGVLMLIHVTSLLNSKEVRNSLLN